LSKKMEKPKGVDPQRWGRPMWVVLHALAYLAAVGRLDALVVRRTFEDMRVLLPCKKCRVGFTELVREVPIPSDAESMLPWANEAHNAVNRKLGKEEVSMYDGLGGLIASMGAAHRRAFVVGAAVSASEYTRRCVLEREAHAQYAHELPALRAAWSRFKAVVASLPVALRPITSKRTLKTTLRPQPPVKRVVRSAALRGAPRGP
jgi:hypothetical protein